MLMTQSVHTNSLQPEFLSLQLSFSTADIEKSLFYTPEYTPIRDSEPTGKVTLLVVHGEVHPLKEDIPRDSIPLTEEAGLFRIEDLDQQV